MPLTYEQAKGKDFYRNVQDADEQKHLKALEEEKNRAAISGSALDALNPLRDENGFLLSYEDPKQPGETLTEEYQYVRIGVEQKASIANDVIRHFGDDLQFLEIMPREVEEPAVTQAEMNSLKKDLKNKIEEQEILNSQLDITSKQLQNTIAVQNEVDIPFPNLDEETEDLVERREAVQAKFEKVLGKFGNSQQAEKIAERVAKKIKTTTGD
jgi:hypothetical protein